MAITFTSSLRKFDLAGKAKLKKWIQAVCATEKKTTGDITYTFTDDESLLEMNRQYLQHNTYTDIITFDYSERGKVAGDIFISVDRVKENAAKFGAPFETELHRVMIHGVLHLCGYKDKTIADKARMRSKENSALKKLERL